MEKEQNFGRLERVDLREIWEHESLSFTPWLAKNLHYLGETIGIDLVLEGTETNVGMFRADILAKNVDTDQWVLIENQLEQTDHCHLGQIITYAAGLKPSAIVWIAAQFTDEHVAALDWLNSVIDSTTQIFGIQIEAWRIGHMVAPKLTVVSKPNTWLKETKVRKLHNRKVSAQEIIAFRVAHPNLTAKEVASQLEVSERKVYDALAWQRDQSAIKVDVDAK